ncbi:hypothetical protein [Aquimarina algicola]|uniref:PepSY domain-containing protein n=1 Tax=Aquimarina algicola TaxID=2589995 RepID=A0A504JLH2_9FLAO|nr:hypothetical protein [Aquimarina algicola]TPN87431.1 hypothetical protein FHK87_07565 [Aquimarina algicola]
MKKYKYFLLHCFIFVIGCTAQKQFIENDELCEFDQTILKNEKTFFLKDLTQSEINTLNKYKQVEIVNSKDYSIKLFRFSNQDSLITKMVLNKKTNIIKSLFYNVNDGKLSIVDFTYNYGDLPIGTAKFYNKSGEVIKTENDNDYYNYPICFKEAIDIVENKLKGKDSIVAINREKKVIKEKDTLYYWDVFVREISENKEDKPWIYRINASNGKLIDKLKVITVHR